MTNPARSPRPVKNIVAATLSVLVGIGLMLLVIFAVAGSIYPYAL